MADIVTPDKRRKMMSGIRSKHTKPELVIRKGLHNLGFRYRLNDCRLVGKPDIVLPKYRAVIFVNGCFWHGHDCHLFRLPKTRTDFWSRKIDINRERDGNNLRQLLDLEWRVGVVWECSIRGKTRIGDAALFEALSDWLASSMATADFRGVA